MKLPRRSTCLRHLLALLACASLVSVAGCTRLEPDSPMEGLLFWPDGNAAAGLQAFKDLKCYQCHRVESIPELAALNEKPLGPALDSATARRNRVDILVQIVAPGTDPFIQESHMGHFDDVMTVSQLTDLIALVESLHT